MPPEECWVHPTIEVRPSRIAGRGLFATSPIVEGRVVVRFGGKLMSTEELRVLFNATPDSLKRVANEDSSIKYLDAISLYDDIHLVIPFGENEGLGRDVHFNNDSCDPNIWHADAYTSVARRNIGSDEELTVDHSTRVASEGMRFECTYGSKMCSHTVTGSDWRLQELQDRYGTYWTPVLLERIRREQVYALHTRPTCIPRYGEEHLTRPRRIHTHTDPPPFIKSDLSCPMLTADF